MKNPQLNLFDLAHKLAASLSISLPPMRRTADIMTRKINILTLDNTISDFLTFMKINKVRHVAIFDPPTETESKPFFIGIISERDVLRFTSPYVDKTISASQHRKAMKKLLVKIVTRKPVCVSTDTPIHQLISVMIENHIDMVPVLDDTELLGIVTTTDILELLVTFDTAVRNLSQTLKTPPSKDSTDSAALAEWINRTAGPIMTRQPYCLALKDTLEKAIDLLKKKVFRHVLVTDKKNHLVGVVSDRDILRHLPYAEIPPNYKPKHFRDNLFSVPPGIPELDIQLAHIMEWELLCITEDCSIADAAEKLQTEKLSCLPVLNTDRNLSGIITVTDLMLVLLHACEPLPALPTKN
jgi:CBS domain-containing protein